MIIFCEASSAFSADCSAIDVCWVTLGRVQVFDGNGRGPNALTSGRAASTKLTTGPMIGSGRIPAESLVVTMWAAVRWYRSSRSTALRLPSPACHMSSA